MNHKELAAEHMKIGSQFREGLRREMDHEHLERAERILNDTLHQLGDESIHSRNYKKAVEIIKKHPSWEHLSPTRQKAFKTAIESRIGIPTNED